MIAGVATALYGTDHPVFGVESDAHPFVSRSFFAKAIVMPSEIRHIDTVADGIALLRIGEAGFSNILRYVRSVASLPEAEVEAALAYLKEQGIEAEGAAAVPIAALLFGGLNLPSFRIPQDLPVVTVLSGRNIDPALMQEVKERSSRLPWEKRRNDWEVLQKILESKRYLSSGEVRALTDFDDAKGLIDLILAHLPDGWDLLDVFSRLHFGPWRPTGHKDINASLRSMGEIQERWEGSKGATLLHPLNGRATVLNAAMDLVDKGKKTLEALEGQLRLAPLVPRLEVETYVAEIYLQRPDWLLSLWPHLDEVNRNYESVQMRRANQETQKAIQAYWRLARP